MQTIILPVASACFIHKFSKAKKTNRAHDVKNVWQRVPDVCLCVRVWVGDVWLEWNGRLCVSVFPAGLQQLIKLICSNVQYVHYE